MLDIFAPFSIISFVLDTQRISVTVAHRTLTPFAGVRIPHPLPSKGYKKDVAQETPDFIGGFAVSTAEKTTSDFVDVKKILFPF